jgi:RNA polymerase sigma-70 factor, ECF subfamily
MGEHGDTTSVSLLRRLREPAPEDAWRRFVELYAPLIFHWGRRQGMNSNDAADLVQEVLAVMVVKLPEFQHDPTQRFRGWLRTVTLNKARDLHRRAAARPAADGDDAVRNVAVADTADLFDEAEYRGYLVGRALALMQGEFRDTTWRACWLHVAEGRSAADVGSELGISANAVHVAKCRVMRRLRQELDGLMD